MWRNELTLALQRLHTEQAAFTNGSGADTVTPWTYAGGRQGNLNAQWHPKAFVVTARTHQIADDGLRGDWR